MKTLFLFTTLLLLAQSVFADFRIGDTVMMPGIGVQVGEIVALSENSQTAVILEHAYPGSVNFDGKWTVALSAIVPETTSVTLENKFGVKTEYTQGQSVRFYRNGRGHGTPTGVIMHIFKNENGKVSFAIRPDDQHGDANSIRDSREVW